MNEKSAVQTGYVEMAAELVSAYVSRNSIPMAELPFLMQSVHASLAGLGFPAALENSAPPLRPAVPVRKSVTDDYIVSLEDGRKLKSMKRYLSKLGMTPADYRAKWGLPNNYPMVAPVYAKQRSELARSAGLGRKPAPAPEPVVEPRHEAPAPKRGGRRRAA